MIARKVYISLNRGATDLPASRVAPEVGEGGGEPVVDLVQGQLLIRGLLNGLEHKVNSILIRNCYLNSCVSSANIFNLI